MRCNEYLCAVLFLSSLGACGDETSSELEALNSNVDKLTETIDLRPYFQSGRVPSHINPASRYFEVSRSGNQRVLAHVKWNQPDNYELFFDDGTYLLSRYEVTRQEYLQSGPSVRRFDAVPANIAAPSGVEKIYLNSSLGWVWTKRFMVRDKVYLVSNHQDRVNRDTGALQNTARYANVFVSVHKTDSDARLSYAPDYAPGHFITLRSQWHECDIEEYDHVKDIGIVRWHAWKRQGCSGYDASQTTRTFRNYFLGGATYSYSLNPQSHEPDAPYQSDDFPGPRVTAAGLQTYYNGVFVDDMPYHETSCDLSAFEDVRDWSLPAKAEVSGNCVAVPGTTQNLLVDQYLGFFSRDPDADGYSYWFNYLDQAPSIGRCEQLQRYMFQNSPHASGSTSDASFVDSLYRATLGRGSDAGGRSYWLAQLDAGLSRTQTLEYFLDTGEAQSRCSAATQPL